MHPNDLLSIVEYPLSFYDAVNQCQLDLVTGCLKPNNTFLADAIRLNLLDPKSAYIVTPASPNPIDLSEAVRKGIITSSNKVIYFSFIDKYREKSSKFIPIFIVFF